MLLRERDLPTIGRDLCQHMCTTSIQSFQGRTPEEVVLKLVDELGFDAVDAGPLGESWRQQPGTPVYTTDLDAAGVRSALQQASRERRPEFRAA